MNKAEKKYKVFNPWAALGLVFIHILCIGLCLTFTVPGRMAMIDWYLLKFVILSAIMPAVYIACCYFIHEMSRYEK